MPILEEKSRSAIQQIKQYIKVKLEYLRERLEYLLGIHPVYKGLIYTPEEQELIGESSVILKEFFPEPPGQALLEEDFESRCEAIEEMGVRLIDLYGLQGCEIIITDEPEEFSAESGFLTYGYASMAENRVYINANCLRSDDPCVLEHVVSNIMHELRHIMQYNIAKLELSYGVPYGRRKLWRANIVNYIDACHDLEGYFSQPIEYDARNFAGRVWQNAYHSNVIEI